MQVYAIVTDDLDDYDDSCTTYASSNAIPPCPVTPTCAGMFSDVKPVDAYYDDIMSLVATKTVSGYADGTFRPSQPVTRAQLAKIVGE